MAKWTAAIVSLFLVGVSTALADDPPAAKMFAPNAAPAGDNCGTSSTIWECPAQDRAWFDAELLLWWFKKSPEPIPLVTTGTSTTGFPGISGQPGTQTVIGGAPIDTDGHWGSRFTAGYWLDRDQSFGVEAGYFFLAGHGGTESASTSGLPGSPNLAVPFFDVTGAARNVGLPPSQLGQPGEWIYVLPGPLGPTNPGFAGVMTVHTSSQLEGADLHGLWNVSNGSRLRLDTLFGFRWLQLGEDSAFNVQTMGLRNAPPFAAGAFFNTQDSFRTRNDFYGIPLGVKAEYSAGRFIFRATADVALGDMHEAVDVAGTTETSSGNISFATGNTTGQILPGGIFAQQTNGGHHSTDRVAVVPQVNVQIGYDLNGRVRVFVGYDFLYASAVARPGDQLDRNINTSLTGLADAARAAGIRPVPAPGGPALPSFPFHDSDFWAQGVSLGFEVRF